MRLRSFATLTATTALLAAAAAQGCGSDADGTTAAASGAGGGASGTGGATSASAQQSSTTTLSVGSGGATSSAGGGSGEGGACAQSESSATLVSKPVDIIFVVGNNGSLTQEIEAIEANINDSFATVIGSSGVDYQVILLSKYGRNTNSNVCVEEPLSGATTGTCATVVNTDPPANNPPRYHHYDLQIDQNDSWCKVLGSFDGTMPDENGVFPNGWSTLLRDDAFKVFVMITDSVTDCSYGSDDFKITAQSPSNPSQFQEGVTEAAEFDAALLALSPTHFGTANNRNYRWHSIVGLAAKDANDKTAPWLPADDISGDKCDAPGASPVSPSHEQQNVSVLSGGLRFPVCEYANFDTVFNTIAQGIIAGSAVACELPIPEPPAGETLDEDTLQVDYTPGDGGAVVTYNQVDNLAACDTESFYIDSGEIVLCPDVCTAIQSDDGANIAVKFGCELNLMGPN